MSRPLIPGIPRLPPLTLHHGAQLRPLHHHPTPLPPRPPEIRRPIPHPGHRLHITVIQHIVALIAFAIPSVGGDVALAFDTDIASAEPCARALAEDEVGGAVDVRAEVDLVPFVGQNRVLIADKFASVIPLAIRLRGHGEGLAARAARVFHIDIVDLEIRRMRAEGGCHIIVGGGVLREGLGEGDRVGLVGCCVGGGAVKRQSRLQGWDVGLFFVGAGVDEYALCGSGGFREGGDGGGELGASERMERRG